MAASPTPFNSAHPDFSWDGAEVAFELANYDPIFAIASALPERPPGQPGRPPHHPEVLYVYFAALVGAFGSHRKAASWLRNPRNWRWLKTAWEARGISLDRPAPSRGTCCNGVERISASVGDFAEALRVESLAQTIRDGALLDAAGTEVEPGRANVIVADGTVPAMRLKKTTYDERLRKPLLKKNGDRLSLPDARRYKQGDGQWVMGEKFVILSARPSSNINSRVILDVRHCDSADDGGEAAVATEAILDLRRRAKGLHGVRYDNAFRGTHVNRLVKAGLSVVSPQHGNTKPRFLGVKHCACGQEHYLASEAGWLCLADIAEDGEEVRTRLTRRKVSFIRNRDTYRCYLEVVLPCGEVHRERLDQTEDDLKTGFNRCEHLRQHPPGSDAYERTMGWRSDIESANNNLDTSLYRGRMVADRRDRQLLVLLGHALARNCMAHATARDRAAMAQYRAA